MRVSERAVALLCAAALAGSATAQEPVTLPEQAARPAARAGDYPYQLFVPRGYDAGDRDARRQRWPLMIFLHGSGERGSDPAQVTKWGPPHVVAAHPGTPMLVASPQLPDGAEWDVATLDRLLADLRRGWRVDPARIYLTGLSLGGIGAWRWALARPETFAALVPVAARVKSTEGACRLRDVPVWAFHGDDDDVVPPLGNFAMVEAVRACRGAVKPRMTVFAATNHNSWTPAYDDPALWRWIAEQRRPIPAP